MLPRPWVGGCGAEAVQSNRGSCELETPTDRPCSSRHLVRGFAVAVWVQCGSGYRDAPFEQQKRHTALPSSGRFLST